MNTPQNNAPHRLPALALASLLTIAMLLGINTLAQVDNGAAQMAQQASLPRG